MDWDLRRKPLNEYAERESTGIPSYRRLDRERISPFYQELYSWIGTVLFYIGGKPDTEGWREEFAAKEMTQEGTDFLSINGRIYPMWAILEIEELHRRYPEYFKP